MDRSDCAARRLHTFRIKSFELGDVEVLFPNDDTAVATYRVTQVVQTKGQSKGVTQEMADLSTWVRSGGKWRCVMHTESPLASQRKAS